MTPEQKRVEKAVAYLQDYMTTYSNQKHYLDYSDSIIIDDVLYGLGVALDADEYSFASGYDRFKDRLRSHLAGEKNNE